MEGATIMRAHAGVGASLMLLTVIIAAPADAADADFTFKTAYRNVVVDPDRIWTGDALSPNARASIFEYELRSGSSTLLVSQIWNDDCASNTCPTRLARIDATGGATVLVDDMMHQVIPPNDPRFAGLPKTGQQAAFAAHPFRLSSDGKTLVNGDFKFEIGEAKR